MAKVRGGSSKASSRALSSLVLGSAAIVEHVWGYVGSGNEDLVKVHIHRLRQKIEDDPQSPMHVRTVPGAGYIIPERVIDEPHVES
ncbi:MAG: winged helix family transcriptional regulator [Chloroflexi bacterium]|nr:winged helix family transcriptional regulator [Chloroflexota bacterium]